MIKLSKKAEKQFAYVSNKFNITRREFATYYENVRKVNKKMQRDAKKGNSLYTPKYTYKVTHLVDRKFFLLQMRKLKKMLDRNFRKQSNANTRETAYHNLRRAFGTVASRRILEELEKLNDKQFKNFFENPDNKDIRTLPYDSKGGRLLRFIGESVDDIINRLDLFTNKRKMTRKNKSPFDFDIKINY